MTYKAPVADILYTLNHIAGFSRFVDEGMFDELDMETVEAILEEGGRLANEELAPLNRKGDENPAKLVGMDVVTPPGWGEAYAKFVEGGWNALSCPTEFGGHYHRHQQCIHRPDGIHPAVVGRFRNCECERYRCTTGR